MSEQNGYNGHQNSYSFSYSARQQAEIRAIRAKYLPPEEDKLLLLRRMEEGVIRRGTIAALAAGILSCLLLGVGMCCCMVWGGAWFIPGILIGLLGIGGMGLAYSLYSRILKQERARIAPQVLRLTEELLK